MTRRCASFSGAGSGQAISGLVFVPVTKLPIKRFLIPYLEQKSDHRARLTVARFCGRMGQSKNGVTV